MSEKKFKTTEAQRRAVKKYKEKNKEKVKIQGAKGATMWFIRNHANADDILQIENELNERKKLL